MRFEVGSTIEFTYTDRAGETRVWKGQVREVEDAKGYFKVKTEMGLRTFRFENIHGEVKVLAAA